METNLNAWDYYQPGFVHPDFVPYLRKTVTDAQGKKVSVNSWQVQGPPINVNPSLVRKNWRLSFMNRSGYDPCPPGFHRADGGYCEQDYIEKNYTPVFYTDKAFIAKNQYWAKDQPEVRGRPLPPPSSSETDLRSVNLITGKYTVYYNPVKRSQQKSTSKQRPTSYIRAPTKDSYLS